MPAVVQALRPVIAQSAVLGSPNQAAVPADDLVEEAVRVENEDRDGGDRRGRRDRRKVERRAEERPATDLLVDDEGHQQAERHLEGDDDDRVLDRVLDRFVEGRVVEEVAVVLQPDALDLPEDSPLEEADVDRVPERVDEEDSEDRQREEDEGVAPAGLTNARSEERAASRGRSRLACGCSSRKAVPFRADRPHGRGVERASYFFSDAFTFASISATVLFPAITDCRSLFMIVYVSEKLGKPQPWT